MKPRTLAVLALLVVSLGAFIWFFERGLPGTDLRAERQRLVLGGVTAEEVAALTLELGDEPIRLERQGPLGGEPEDATEAVDPATAATEDFLDRRWRLVEPINGAADDARIRGLVTDLAGLERKSEVEDPDPAALGLDPPRARITVEPENSAAGDRPRVVELGAEVPVSGDLLVRLAGESEIWLTEGGLLADLPLGADGWRSKEVLPFAPSAVRSVRVEVPGSAADGGLTLVLGERHDGRFRLLEPVEDPADADETRALLTALETLEVARFLPAAGPPSPTATAEPIRLVVKGPAGQEPLRLDLFGGEGSIRGRLDGELVELTGVDDLMARIARPADAWRSRRWTGLDLAVIDRVRLRPAEGDEILLERGEVDWLKNGEDIPYGPVRGLLIQLTAARADRVLSRSDAEANGLLTGGPVWEIDIEPSAESGAKTETLRVYGSVEGADGIGADGIGADDKGTAGVPVARDGRDAVLLLPDDQWQELRAALEATAEP